MRKIKAHGQRGSWFAEVEGEILPCVHAHWWKSPGYNDIYARPGNPRYEKFVHEIMEKGRVIVTKDDFGKDGQEFNGRIGYIGIYEVDDVQFDADGLRFRFTRRLADLV